MRTPFNAHWLETGACVPVDIKTTAELLEEIRRLHHDAFLDQGKKCMNNAKLTEEQIWKCNQTINYEKGEVVDAVHICVAHQNVVDFARAIEREIGFDRAELWIKRINDAVEAERVAQRQWVGLTEDEIDQIMEIGLGVRASIETALDKIEEKNT